jgi:predicted phosphoadenosine phosphosulfate sulfurtransferase
MLVRYDAEEDSLVTEFYQQRRILKRRYNHFFQADIIHHNMKLCQSFRSSLLSLLNYISSPHSELCVADITWWKKLRMRIL